MLRNLISSFMVLTLLACAPGGGDDDKVQQRKDRDKLTAINDQITGFYEGTLLAYKPGFSDGDEIQVIEIPIKLGVYAAEEESGNNSSGQPIHLPRLKMKYRQDDMIRPDETLTVSFSPEDGRIEASAETPAGGKEDSRIKNAAAASATTINAQLLDGTIKGEISRGGKIGDFTAKLKNKIYHAPLSDIDEYMDRLAIQYEKMTGIYKGWVKGKTGADKKDFPIIFELRSERVFVDGVRVARLIGIYSRQDLGDNNFYSVRNFNNIGYAGSTHSADLFMEVYLTNGNYMKIYGRFQNQEFSGTMEDRIGSGSITFAKESSN